MTEIVTATDNTASLPSSSTTVLQIENPGGQVGDVDPLSQMISTSGRVTQQRVIPGGVKQRHLEVEFENAPTNLSKDPGFVIFGPISSGISKTVTWTTSSTVSAQQQLFAMTTMSFYFSLVSYPTYATFRQSGSLWPNGLFNMTNVICSFWNDEESSDGYNIVSKQSFYNFSGAPVYVMAAIRLRLFSNSNKFTSK